MIECVDPLTDVRWEEALSSRSDATSFHRAAWLQVLQSTYGFTPCALLKPATGDKPSALLPMMSIRSWLTGRRGASLPFTDECEPLASDDSTFTDLVEAAIALGKHRNWRSVEFRGGHRWANVHPAAVSFYGHRLDLSRGADALFATFDGSVRRAIRKAQQSALTVEFATSLSAVREFYELLRRTRQRHGVPPQPFEFFANLQRHVLSNDNGTIVLTRLKGKPVAGAVFLHSERNLIYKFGASNDSFQHLRGNNLVMWTAIERYATNGFQSLDFGRTSLGNDGLRRFKLSWGTTERFIHYYKYDLVIDRYVTSRDQASGWHNRLFQMLPRSLSQWIGALLYKHIA